MLDPTCYKNILEMSHDALIITSKEGQILEANPTAKSLLGEDELARKSIYAFVGLDEKNAHKEHIALILKKGHGTCQGHKTSLIRNGNGIPVKLYHGILECPYYKNEKWVIFRLRKKRKAYLKKLLDSLSIGHLTCDIDSGQIFNANQVFADMLGYSKEELKTLSWVDITPEYYIQQELKENKERIARKELGSVFREKAFRKKNGQEVPVYIQFSKIFNPYLEREVLECFITDITELKEKEYLLADILDIAQEGVGIGDSYGNLDFVNNAYSQITGRTKEELLREGWKKSMKATLADQTSLILRRIEEGISEREKFEREYIRPDGTIKIAHIIYKPIKLKGKTNILASISDVTELKEAQKKIEEAAILKLEETSNYYQEIFDSATEGICIFDKNGKLYNVNSKLSHMLSYTKKDMTVTDFSWESIVVSDYKQITFKKIEEAMTNLTPQHYELNLLKKEGINIPTLTSFIKLTRQKEWDEERLVACIIDITELKTTQNKLEKALRAQQETIKELSTPALPIWKDVTMIPLIGTYDSLRMKDLSDNLTRVIKKNMSETVLLDLSALKFVDSIVIAELIKLIKAMELLGTRTILVGIEPDMAHSIVRLGADLENVPKYSTLEKGLKRAIR